MVTSVGFFYYQNVFQVHGSATVQTRKLLSLEDRVFDFNWIDGWRGISVRSRVRWVDHVTLTASHYVSLLKYSWSITFQSSGKVVSLRIIIYHFTLVRLCCCFCCCCWFVIIFIMMVCWRRWWTEMLLMVTFDLRQSEEGHTVQVGNSYRSSS